MTSRRAAFSGNTSLIVTFSSFQTAVALYGAVVATKTAQVTLDPYKAFQNQPIRMPMHCVKTHS